ncbi:MAG: CAP domain-containing protein [Clostridiales bacterium]|jgi:uncharacterized protein YkwD|nr:CAP domain-containing protein [Clostridiales bacterium]
MIENNYYSHDSPTYGSGHNLINLFSIAYVFWGENIAAGQPTPESVMDAWMDSPGHAENILRPDFSHIGVGYSRSPMHGTLWSQEFITE